MPQAQVRQRLPRPLKRSARWLLGWGYWVRRRVRRQPSASARPDGLAAFAGAHVPTDSVAVPPGTPDSIVAHNEHGRYCVPRSSLHRPVSRAILETRVWEPETLDLVRGADADGDIVHAGTFFGDFIPAFARSRGAGAIVWAFEPNGENYRCARGTIELNELDNVELRNAGLDATSGTALLATTDRTGVPLGGASRVIRDRARAHWTENEEISLVSIDDVLGTDRWVAAIQLDVEGHEQQALTGAMRTIARCRPLLVLETTPPEEWIDEQLTPLGYRITHTVNANTVLRAD